LSRVFFDRNPLGQIINLRSGLSDPHKNGRTVALLQFEAGSVIYKPRSGEGEREWHSLAQWMNNHSFRPKVKAGRVLCRADYSWMEYIGPTPCPDASGARRFFQRIGGMIAASYLLRAVDCHRQNVVAAGEYPVLVDADALWHVSSITKTQDVFGQLCRTGFFPNSLPGSLQSRSSVLGYGALGNHLAGIGEREPGTAQYRREIVTGFNRAWACLLGTRKRGDAFARRIRRIKTRPRRRIYRATEKYAVIRKASIQPGVLRSNRGRKVLIAQLCARDSVSSAVIGAEVAALQRLDIPYFFRRTKAGMPHHRSGTPYDALETLKRVLSEGADRLGS
jgi:lantibiotic modifying enzyme